MRTKNTFAGNDDFDPEEAMEAALENRKFLIEKASKSSYFYQG